MSEPGEGKTNAEMRRNERNKRLEKKCNRAAEITRPENSAEKTRPQNRETGCDRDFKLLLGLDLLYMQVP